MIPRVLETERLRLDAVTETDQDAVLVYVQDGDLQATVPVPVPYGAAEATGAREQQAGWPL